MSKPIRVLHMVGVMHPGGMENFIMNLYRSIDREKVQFDIIVHGRTNHDYVEQIKAMGGMVYELPRLTSKPLQNLKQIYQIVKKNQYPIVIRHTANALISPQLLAARFAGAKTICHSHNETDPQKMLHKLGRLLMRYATVKRLACSVKAGQWMFGKLDYEVIHNAIDIDKYAYKPEKAQNIIEEFHLEHKHVYGHIANFIESKNHMYLLSIYAEIIKQDPNAVCFCLGEGKLRPQIEQEIERLGIRDHVILTGVRHDAEKFMSCFDVLIFPSVFEGLPLTLIEAQAAGLPCLISDTITKDVIVSQGLVEMESIESEPKVWAQKAIAYASEKKARTCQYEMIAQHGYDVKALAKWYEHFFTELI